MIGDTVTFEIILEYIIVLALDINNILFESKPKDDIIRFFSLFLMLTL